MEHEVSEFLINVWASILTVMLSVYVALDGFDLGVGILSLIERNESRKAAMMDCLNGIWDANETWLVLLGGTLFGAFPLAYAAVLEALYIPVLLMLFALIFRGVSFEYRLYAKRKQHWTLAFGAGSLLAAIAQGLALGGLLGGLNLTETGSPVALFVWVSPFSLMAAVLLANVYVLFGACYLLRKMEDELLESARRWAWRAALSLIVLLPMFLLYSVREMPHVLNRWLSEPFMFAMLAIFLAFSMAILLQKLRQRRDDSPFFWCMVGLALAVIGLVASHYPYLVPGIMTLHAAASTTRTLEFMLFAISGLLPLMLGYNVYQYYVFRGKVKSEH